MFVFFLPAQTKAQNSVTITFTCLTSEGGYLQPDSITIENLTRNWIETIYYPDTIYTLVVGTSVPDHSIENGMKVMPNPFDGTTRIHIRSSKTENVKITLTDMGGRICAKYNGLLQEGINQFFVSLATPQTYVLSVQSSSGIIRSLKMENVGYAGTNRIKYEGEANINKPMIQLKSSSSHPFQLGDEIRYQGFATYFGNTVQSQQVTQGQNADETILLVFPDWSPSNGDGLTCPGTPTVTDHQGNVYNTVQIGDQCWTKENMRCTTSPSTGTYLIKTENMGQTYAGKQACWYNDSATYAPLDYGVLYNWNAAVDTFNTVYENETVWVTFPEAAVDAVFTGKRRGICPQGWHIPSDTEWTQLTVYVSSQSQYRCDDDSSYIAKALASTTGWDSGTNTCAVGNNQTSNNSTGFNALPIGRYASWGFQYFGQYTDFWSSTSSGISINGNNYLCASCLTLSFYFATVSHSSYGYKNNCYSVRCLRD